MKNFILLIAVVLVSIFLVIACESKTSIFVKPLSSTSPFVWSTDAHCADCHLKEVKSMSDDAFLASRHAMAGNYCLDCHDTADMRKAHINIDGGPPLSTDKYSNEICFECHGNYENIINLTKDKTRLNPHDSHYGKINCFICHKVHTAKFPDEFCVSCHISMN